MASSTRRSTPELAKARREEARIRNELDKHAKAMERIKAALKSGRKDLVKLTSDLDDTSTGKTSGTSGGKSGKAGRAKADSRTAKATSRKSGGKSTRKAGSKSGGTSGSKSGSKKGAKTSR